MSPSYLRFFLTIFLYATFLSACSDSSSDHSVSGQLTVSSRADVDSDVNDIQAVYVSNNDPAEPQIIKDDVILQGFASRYGTDGDEDTERFADKADADDYFRVYLRAGQQIQLDVVDFNYNAEDQNLIRDLDLYLYYADNPTSEIAYSNKFSQVERINITADGNYLIDVRAFLGSSKYVLSLLPTDYVSPLNTSQTSHSRTTFVADQAIVKRATKSSGSNASALAITDNRPTLVTLSQVVNQNSSNGLARTLAVTKNPLEVLSPDAYKARKTLEDIKTLSMQDGVEYVSPNFIRRPLAVTPGDPYFNEQWYLNAVNLPQAWTTTKGYPQTGQDNVVVAVIDSGIYLRHPDLAGQLISGYDFISDPDNALDGDGIDDNPDDPGDSNIDRQSSFHGTHVAGTIAAASNNGVGVTGISWGAKIMPVRVLGLGGGGTSMDIIQALYYAAGMTNDSKTLPAHPADIINLSFGSEGYSVAEADVINQIRRRRIIVVAAAGNDGNRAPFYPASYEGVISVGATDYNGDRSSFSNYGATMDLLAPGGGVVVSGDAADKYKNGILNLFVNKEENQRTATLTSMQGTSMSAPVVSGLFALAKAVYPQLTPEIADALIETCSITDQPTLDCEHSSGRGYGQIDAVKLVDWATDLAAGAPVPELPVRLRTSPASLYLDQGSQTTFLLYNAGGGTPTISSATSDQDWLSVSVASTDDYGFGNYRVSVNRSGLSNGYYSGLITFTTDESSTLEFKTTILVGDDSTPLTLSPQLVQLLDEEDNSPQYLTISEPDGSFHFGGVSGGEYRVIAGSDIDADHTSCDSGETCGQYLRVLDVDGDKTGIDFSVNIENTYSQSPLPEGMSPPQIQRK